MWLFGVIAIYIYCLENLVKTRLQLTAEQQNSLRKFRSYVGNVKTKEN